METNVPESSRRCVGRNGEDWEVRERLSKGDEAGAIEIRRLIFETPQMIRVVLDYPPQWRSLSSDELAGLAERR